MSETTKAPFSLRSMRDRKELVNARAQKRVTQARYAEPSVGLSDDLDSILKAPAVGLRGTMYATRTLEFPFALAPDSERIAVEFGQEINYFAMEINSSRTQEINNLISTATVRTPFLVRAIAFVVYGEFEQGALAGYKHDEAVDALDDSLDVPVYDGSGVASGNDRPATLRVGWDVQEFIISFMRAYRLQMFLGGDLRYVDELLGHIGTIEKGSYMQGYGQAQRSVADYIRLANDVMETLGSTERFFPITAGRDDADLATPILPPLIDMQVGSFQDEGMYGCSFPVRPFVALPGVPIDIQLVRENNDQVYYDAMAKALSHGGEVRWTRASTNELTGARGYSCDVQFKYGRLQIGTILLGARITSRCCLDWYFNYGAGLGDIYTGSRANEKTLQTLKGMARELGLSDVPAPRSNVRGQQLLSGLTFPEGKKDSSGTLSGPPSSDDVMEHLRRQGVTPLNPSEFRNLNGNQNGDSLYKLVSRA